MRLQTRSLALVVGCMVAAMALCVSAETAVASMDASAAAQTGVDLEQCPCAACTNNCPPCPCAKTVRVEIHVNNGTTRNPDGTITVPAPTNATTNATATATPVNKAAATSAPASTATKADTSKADTSKADTSKTDSATKTDSKTDTTTKTDTKKEDATATPVASKSTTTATTAAAKTTEVDTKAAIKKAVHEQAIAFKKLMATNNVKSAKAAKAFVQSVVARYKSKYQAMIQKHKNAAKAAQAAAVAARAEAKSAIAAAKTAMSGSSSQAAKVRALTKHMHSRLTSAKKAHRAQIKSIKRSHRAHVRAVKRAAARRRAAHRRLISRMHRQNRKHVARIRALRRRHRQLLKHIRAKDHAEVLKIRHSLEAQMKSLRKKLAIAHGNKDQAAKLDALNKLAKARALALKKANGTIAKLTTDSRSATSHATADKKRIAALRAEMKKNHANSQKELSAKLREMMAKSKLIADKRVSAAKALYEKSQAKTIAALRAGMKNAKSAQSVALLQKRIAAVKAHFARKLANKKAHAARAAKHAAAKARRRIAAEKARVRKIHSYHMTMLKLHKKQKHRLLIAVRATKQKALANLRRLRKFHSKMRHLTKLHRQMKKHKKQMKNCRKRAARLAAMARKLCENRTAAKKAAKTYKFRLHLLRKQRALDKKLAARFKLLEAKHSNSKRTLARMRSVIAAYKRSQKGLHKSYRAKIHAILHSKASMKKRLLTRLQQTRATLNAKMARFVASARRMHQANGRRFSAHKARLLQKLSRQQLHFHKAARAVYLRHVAAVRALRARHRRALANLRRQCSRNSSKWRSRYNALKRRTTQQLARMRRSHSATLRRTAAKFARKMKLHVSRHSAALRRVHAAHRGRLAHMRRTHSSRLRNVHRRHQSAMKHQRSNHLKQLRALLARHRVTIKRNTRRWLSKISTMKTKYARIIRQVARSSCHDFWKATKGRCPRGFKKNSANRNWLCKGQGCIRRCCTQVQHTCSTFSKMYGCPAGYRPRANVGRRGCRKGNCWRTCCENARLGDGICRSWGDPHLVTFDNNRFDCQVVGEVNYYSNRFYDEAVHAAQIKRGGGPSYIYGVAFRSGANVISVKEYSPYRTWGWRARFNGKNIGIGRNGVWKHGPFKVIARGNRMTIINTMSSTKTTWTYGARHRGVYYWNFDVGVSYRARQVANTGACGRYDRNRANDLSDKRGRRCSRSRSTHCCGTWLIPRAKSLFTHVPKASHRFREINLRKLCGSRLHQARQRCHRVKTDSRNACMVEFCAAKGSQQKANAIAESIKENKKTPKRRPSPRKCRRVRVRIPSGRSRYRQSYWTRTRSCSRGTNFHGVCTIARRCARGWRDYGLAGVIMTRHDFRRFRSWGNGGGFNGGWQWTHPRLCCANNHHTQLQNAVYLAKGCRRGSSNRGLIGMIHLNSHYRRQPFHRGGRFNGGWTWTHPRACRVSSQNHINGAHICMPSRTRRCPRGWSDRGYSGLIMHNGSVRNVNRLGMPPGGRYNSGWRWTHPKMCCTRYRPRRCGTRRVRRTRWRWRKRYITRWRTRCTR
jgi:von Willebrand factor type D domain